MRRVACDNRPVSPAATRVRPDPTTVGAADEARAALVELTGVAEADEVGEHLGHRLEGDRVVTHLFACERPGYRGWQWSVTVVRAARAKSVTVNDVVLLPGDDAVVAPAWVPWRERLQPGDLSPGDLLPVEDDDPRLVSGSFVGDEPADAVREVTREVGLGRERVLSLEGRDEAAQRWYVSDQGPEAPVAKSAPAACRTCGFMVLLSGPLSGMFGVCANAHANSDGRVVSFDHGCGAHSAARLSRKQQPRPVPPPSLDELDGSDVESF